MDTNRYTQAVASAVVAAIAANCETQLGVATLTGIPRTTLGRRLTGSSPFTVAELSAIADVLRVPVTDLVDPQPAVA